MNIQIEAVIIVILVFVFLVWLIWSNVSLILLKRKYKKLNDDRTKKQGGEERRAETPRGESVISVEKLIPAGTSQPADRELLPTAVVDVPRENTDVTGKNSNRSGGFLGRIRKRRL